MLVGIVHWWSAPVSVGGLGERDALFKKTSPLHLSHVIREYFTFVIRHITFSVYCPFATLFGKGEGNM